MHESLSRLLAPERKYYNQQSQQERLLLAKQVNYWRQSNRSLFYELTEGVPPSYKKPYQMGELSSRSFLVRSYLPINTEINSMEITRSWRKLNHLSSLRIAWREAPFRSESMIEVYALLNFSRLVSPYFTGMKISGFIRTFIKLTWSIKKALQQMQRYDCCEDFGCPEEEKDLIVEKEEKMEDLFHLQESKTIRSRPLHQKNSPQKSAEGDSGKKSDCKSVSSVSSESKERPEELAQTVV